MKDMVNWLHTSGLGNTITDNTVVYSEKDLCRSENKWKFRALCTSYACTGLNDYGHVVKKVEKSKDYCTDCGCALVWEKYR